MHHTISSERYEKVRIPGHAFQYAACGAVTMHLAATYPKAWEMNGRAILLAHSRRTEEKRMRTLLILIALLAAYAIDGHVVYLDLLE